MPKDVEVSPDGSRVAFTLEPGASSKDAPTARQLWLGSPEPGEPRQVEGVRGASVLRWSPDGGSLVFGAERDESGLLTLCLLDRSGEVRDLKGPPGQIEAIRWSSDGTKLLILAADPGSDAGMASNWKRIRTAEGSPDPRVLKPNQLYRRLYLLDIAGGAAPEVGPEGMTVWEVDWSGDGDAVAIVSKDTDESAWYDASLAVLDLDRRGTRVVYEPEWQIQSLAVSVDGSCAAFVEGWASDRGCGGGAPMWLDLDGPGQPFLVSESLAAERHVQRLRFLGDGSLFYVGQAGVETMCGQLDRDGDLRELWRGPATLGEVHFLWASASDDGSVVVAGKEGPGEPPEVMALGPGDGSWTALTSFNARLGEFAAPVADTVTWESGGHEIEGILVTPASPPPGRLPLLVIVHGGPADGWTLNYSCGYEHLGIPLANRGYAILLPNTRGSTGRGQDFARANLGEFGRAELVDIEAGIESLHAKGVIDRERVGITGVSAGGYTAAYAATCSDAFKVAVPRSCVSNWVSFHLTSNIGRFDELVLESSPYDPTGNHLRLSPVMHAPDSDTPTLIIHGAQDLCCPLGQAQELYQALVEAGATVELIVHEEAGHELFEREYLTDQWQRVTDWFDRYLPA
jgi:dipeptidyl aminopeptidase/acylaminoacyl peptidase